MKKIILRWAFKKVIQYLYQEKSGKPTRTWMEYEEAIRIIYRVRSRDLEGGAIILINKNGNQAEKPDKSKYSDLDIIKLLYDFWEKDHDNHEGTLTPLGYVRHYGSKELHEAHKMFVKLKLDEKYKP